MRVGLNYLGYNPASKRGTLTFARGLLDGFDGLDAQHEYILFVRESLLGSFSFLKSKKIKVTPVYDRLFKVKNAISKFTLWTQSVWLYEFTNRVIWRDVVKKIETECDVIYIPTTVLNIFPYSIPTVLSMHDIQQVHFPQFFTNRELRWREIVYNTSIKYTNYLQASSRFMKDDFLSYFKDLKQDQVFVVSEGVAKSVFSTELNYDVVAKYKLPSDYLYYPAQLWPHKDHLTVLRALHLLKSEFGLEIPLVLTGRKFGSADQIFKFIKEHSMDYVHYLGCVSFDDVRGLFQKAKFQITAVLYESSSLPILEAAAAGCPIIASRTPPNMELGENLKINYFEPGDFRDLASVLKAIWQSQELRKEQIETNNINISRYEWVNVAAKYDEFFTSASV